MMIIPLYPSFYGEQGLFAVCFRLCGGYKHRCVSNTPEDVMESLRSLHKARFTDVLDYGIQLFKKNFRKIFLINLLFNIPIQILLTIVNPMFSNQYLNLFDTTSMISPEPSAMFSSILTLYTMVFGVLALYGLNALTLQNIWQGAVIKLVYSDAVLKQERTIRQVIRECFRQFWTLLGGRVLYGLIQYGITMVLYFGFVIIILAGIFSATGIVSVSITTPWLSVILTILGILIALAAVFFVAVLLSFFFGRFWMFLPSICIEQQKAGTAIGRGGNLGKHGFWLIGLTGVTGYSLAWMFPGIVNSVFTALNLASGSMDVGLMRVSAVITQLFTAVLQPLMTCIMTALYITLRVRREGLDMETTLWSIKKEELEKTQRWMAEAPNAAE